ncbi:hypothetical protein TNCV_1367181 [Trichonephila clavipes]|nr:hypothetical protein TNCV_1367181 [Trichonephila clavipes]
MNSTKSENSTIPLKKLIVKLRTFTAVWTLSLETMAAATLDAASQREASSVVMNLGARIAKGNFFHESRFCLQHQDGRIRVRWHRSEHTLATSIRHRHTSP